MLLGEPARSQWDLSFRLLGFPIRVSVWFWIAAMLLGWSGSSGGDPYDLAAWVLAAFASILIHELGHGFAFRYFGIPAHIVLYQFGGLAIPETNFGGPPHRRGGGRFATVLISLAGPLAQLALAGVLILGLLFSGSAVPLYLGGFLEPLLIRLVTAFQIRLAGPQQLVEFVDLFLFFFLYVSVYWALLNLIPVYPLDGGQIARDLFLIWDRREPVRNSLILSVIAAGLVAVWAFAVAHDTYLGILFGMLAYGSYTALQSYLGHGGYRGRW